MPDHAAPVALYIQRGCAVCHQVRRLLEEHQVDFEIKWLSDPVNVAEMEQISRTYGVMGFPILMIGADLVQGYDAPAILGKLRAAGHRPRAPEAGTSTEATATRVPAAALWVANLAAGLTSFVAPGSDDPPCPPLALGAGAMPCGIGWDPDTDVIAVSDFALHRVTFFDRVRGAPLRGSVEESSLPLPRNPGDIVTDVRRHRFYVSSAEEPGMTALDSAHGSYALGTLDASFVSLPRSTNAIAFDPGLDRIFMRGAGIMAIDAERLEPVTDGVWGQRDVLFGRDVKVHGPDNLLYVPGYGPAGDRGGEEHRLFYLDAGTGDFAFGDAESSSVRTDETPWTVMPAAAGGAVYLACMGSRAVQAFTLAKPATFGDPSRRLEVGPACRSMALSGEQTTLVASSFDASTLTFVDPARNEYRYGTKDRSTVATAEGPRGMLFVGVP